MKNKRIESIGNALLVVLMATVVVAYAMDLGRRTEDRLAARASR